MLHNFFLRLFWQTGECEWEKKKEVEEENEK